MTALLSSTTTPLHHYEGLNCRLVIEWWGAAGERPVEVRDLTVQEAKSADEVFITSSTRDVQAVTSWDNVAFEHGKVTKHAAEVFEAGWMDNLDP
ncbi:hypothetical protein [Bowdeniella nasicola]|uniref:hypothetical protein n=1 Tax=Bowdeniella nasicola TaxID=208480 RepID=UPI0011613B5C|nr:hypothetical protein [Bowdeniella nasicola]